VSSSEISHIDVAWEETRGVRVGELMKGPVKEAIYEADREVEWFKGRRWAEDECR